jgi:hypothetical protein
MEDPSGPTFDSQAGDESKKRSNIIAPICVAAFFLTLLIGFITAFIQAHPGLLH